MDALIRSCSNVSDLDAAIAVIFGHTDNQAIFFLKTCKQQSAIFSLRSDMSGLSEFLAEQLCKMWS